VSQKTTEALIHELTRDLSPVRPMPRLRVVWMSLGLAWVLVAGVTAWYEEAVLNPWWDHPVAFGVLLGLVVTAVGATLASLAGSVPGLEKNASTGWRLLWVGLVMLTVSALWGSLGQGVSLSGFDLADCIACSIYAVVFAVAPLLVASAFLLRGAAAKPGMTAGAAAIGAVSLGALAVHALCSDADGMHVLLAHFLLPLFVAALIAIPLGIAARRKLRQAD
jgi:hypothetical protein